MKDEVYSVKEAAAILRVHEKTVRRWIAAGLVVASQCGASGRYSIPAGEVSKLAGRSGAK